MSDTFSLGPSPEVFNAVMDSFLDKLQAIFPGKKQELATAQRRMRYLNSMNATAVMNHFREAMQPFQAAICQLDTGFLVTGLPQLKLLQGRVSAQDLLAARPEDRLLISNYIKDLYILSEGPQGLPEDMMAEVDRLVGAITDNKEALQALDAAFEQITNGQAPSPEAMAELQRVMQQSGLPGLPGGENLSL